MRTMTVCLAALTCWAFPVSAKERTPVLEHELVRRTPLNAPAKPDVPAVSPLGAEKPACPAPAAHDDAKITEAIGAAARADVEKTPPEALAEAAARSIPRLEEAHGGQVESVRSHYLHGVCRALSARGVTGDALKAALSSLNQRLAEVAPAPVKPIAEGGGASAAKPEQPSEPAVAPAPAPASAPPLAPAGAQAADPAPAVEDAMREADVKLAPPDEQKAIDFALKPFEDGHAGAPSEQTAPAEAPPAAVQPPEATATEPSINGKAPQEEAPTAPSAPAPAADSPTQGNQERRSDASEQPSAEASPAQAATSEPAPEPSQAAAGPSETGLGDNECVALGAVVQCDQANVALAGLLKAPDDFDHPGSMQLGGKSDAKAEIAFAVRVDGKTGDAQARISEAQRGQSARLSAKLMGDGFEIEPAGLQERAAQPGQEIRWSWAAAPVASGPGKSLKLELYAHPVDRNGERSPILVKTLAASVDVGGAPPGAAGSGPGKAAGSDKVMGQAGGGDPMVYGGVAALVISLATAVALLMRGRSPRSGSLADPGEVLGDLRETTGAPRPFRFTSREPGGDSGGAA